MNVTFVSLSLSAAKHRQAVGQGVSNYLKMMTDALIEGAGQQAVRERR